MVSGSTTLQNFTFLNATGTSATTTNFFATNSSADILSLTDSANSDLVTFESGSGSPEGAVTAPLGSLYSDHTTGTLYTKRTGDNTNTGWIAINATSTSGTLTATSSNSGIEITSDGISLLRGCSDDETLKWNAANSEWECASDRATVQGFTTGLYTNNSIVLTDVTDVNFAIGANENWFFRFALQINGDAQDDSQWSVTCPAGATGDWSVASPENASSQGDLDCGATSNLIIIPNGDEPINVQGLIQNGGTAGTIQLQAREAVNADAVNALQVLPGSFFQAWKLSGADYAELYYDTAGGLTPGYIVTLDPTAETGVIKASSSTQDIMLGVVSTEPASVIGDIPSVDIGSPVPIALSGRVPVLVSDANGQIRAGDRLTVSTTTPGVAVKALKAGSTIGIALVDQTSTSNTSTVNVFISKEYYAGADGALTTTGLATFENGFVSQASSTITSELTIAGTSTANTLVITGDRSIFAGSLAVGTTSQTAFDTILGVDGALSLASITSPATTESALYNQSGALYWNGNQVLSLEAIGTTGQTVVFDEEGSPQATSSLFIDISGNIGIGSITPSERLVVEGNSIVSGTSTASVFTATSSVATSTFAGGVFFATEGGAVGIGTTTARQALTVEGTIQASNLFGGQTSLRADAQGNIIRNPSDENLKEEIETVENALEKVLGLRGVTYYWKDQDRFGEQQELGFIAQEVEEVLPQVVSDGGEYKSVSYENITAVVVGAVQDLYDLLGAKIVDGVAYIADLVVRGLTVGTSEKPNGITLYDDVTGEPYCLRISEGQTVAVPGECVAGKKAPSSGEQSSSSTPSAPATTEEEDSGPVSSEEQSPDSSTETTASSTPDTQEEQTEEVTEQSEEPIVETIVDVDGEGAVSSTGETVETNSDNQVSSGDIDTTTPEDSDTVVPELEIPTTEEENEEPASSVEEEQDEPAQESTPEEPEPEPEPTPEPEPEPTSESTE